MALAHVIGRFAIRTFKLPLLLNVDEQLKKWKRLLMPFSACRNDDDDEKLDCALSLRRRKSRRGTDALFNHEPRARENSERKQHSPQE